MNAHSALSNCRVLVTRPVDQADEFCRLLAAEGAVAVCQPLIEIAPPSDLTEIISRLQSLATYDWVIFASTNAVQNFFEAAQSGQLKLNWGETRIAAIGTATALELEKHGLRADYVPTSFVAESLVAEFPGFPQRMTGLRILWPKTDIGRTYIADEFTAAGASVDTIVCYHTRLPSNAQDVTGAISALLSGGAIDVLTFTSSQTVRNFRTLLADFIHREPNSLSNVLVAVIGPETARTAEKLLLKVDIVAAEHTIPGLIREIGKFAVSRNMTFPRLR